MVGSDSVTYQLWSQPAIGQRLVYSCMALQILQDILVFDHQLATCPVTTVIKQFIHFHWMLAHSSRNVKELPFLVVDTDMISIY